MSKNWKSLTKWIAYLGPMRIGTSWVLPVIVFAQFCCTSLWFAGNAVAPNLINDFSLPTDSLGHMTSSVQLGFILGTLTYALLGVADRFSPSKVFMVSALLGGLFNLVLIFFEHRLFSLLLLRFFTGFFLAGIYPVGMKIAADHYQRLGRALGFLVGALVLGTALPHLIKGSLGEAPWQWVTIATTLMAVAGGLLIWMLVPDGPFRKQSQRPDLTAIFRVFKDIKFRKAAFGYFGHMWELYTFWAFVPIILLHFSSTHALGLDISLLSFSTIAIGALSCILGGIVSERLGTLQTARVAIFSSGICCLLSPLVLSQDSAVVLIVFLLIWGFFVIADSPLFSTLVAQNATPELVGTSLTIVNSLGFALTIVSIQAIGFLSSFISQTWLYTFLALGPTFGILSLMGQAKS